MESGEEFGKGGEEEGLKFYLTNLIFDPDEHDLRSATDQLAQAAYLVKKQPPTPAYVADRRAQDAQGKPEEKAADPKSKNKTKITEITETNFHHFGFYKKRFMKNFPPAHSPHVMQIDVVRFAASAWHMG